MSMMTQGISLHLPNIHATRRLGSFLGRSLPAGSILLLEGDLGSGKTTLVQSIGNGLGIQELIVSPTFTLVNEYLEGRIPLYHLDLYRLSSDNAAALHPEIYWEGIEYEPGIVAIEWGDRLPQWPDHYLHIRLSYSSGLLERQNQHNTPCIKEEGRVVQLHVVGNVQLDLASLPYIADQA